MEELFQTDIINVIQGFRLELLVFLISYIVLRSSRGLVILNIKKLSQKTKNSYDDLVASIVETFGRLAIFTTSLIIALMVGGLDLFQYTSFAVVIVFAFCYQINKIIDVIFDYLKRRAKGVGGKGPLQGFKAVLYILVWVVGGLSVIDLLGYNVNSVIAGLGIGGIAVALAVQNILSDMFSSFSIYFDRPFSIGDYIVVGSVDGTVESIGLKSTRIRSLRGEQVILSNRELTNQIIQNFGLLKRRRVVEEIGFDYDTPNKKLEKLKEDIEHIVEAVPQTEFERLYFRDFGDSSLLFELSYYVNSEDFEEFTQVKHRVNLDIKSYVEKKKINMPYPTTRILTAK